MSGHSKWSSIKHKKASADAKRGNIFTKIVKEISVAARIGGGDPEGNPRLRTAIEKAKEVNMPQDNMKRAIMKGTGELPGVSYEEFRYEGYGPGGVAILVDVLTDNKNRTVPEIRHIMSKHGGNLGETGCVSWIFENRGYILVDKGTVDEDTLMGITLEAGALDLRNDPNEDNYEVITLPEDLSKIKSALEKAAVPFSLAEATMLPKNYVMLDEKHSAQMLKLIDVLEDNEDVQNVYANFDMADELVIKAGR